MSNQIGAILGVGVILIRRDGRILLGERTKIGESQSWCLPGGRLEVGESFESAAVRELAEETGITHIEGTQFHAVAIQLNALRSNLTGAVSAWVNNGEDSPRLLEPEVFSSWRWFMPTAPPKPLFPASAAVLAAWQHATPPLGWRIYPCYPKQSRKELNQ